MIINLHVPQLWPLYLTLMVTIDGSLLWISSKLDDFEIKSRKYKLSVDMRALSFTFAALLSSVILAFVIYIWIYVFKIKIISGV